MTQKNETDLKRQIDLMMSILDDLTKMYLKLENDLWTSGVIQKKYSDDGKKYDIYKDD